MVRQRLCWGPGCRPETLHAGPVLNPHCIAQGLVGTSDHLRGPPASVRHVGPLASRQVVQAERTPKLQPLSHSATRGRSTSSARSQTAARRSMSSNHLWSPTPSKAQFMSSRVAFTRTTPHTLRWAARRWMHASRAGTAGSIDGIPVEVMPGRGGERCDPRHGTDERGRLVGAWAVSACRLPRISRSQPAFSCDAIPCMRVLITTMVKDWCSEC